MMVLNAPRQIGYEDYPDDPLPPDGVRIKTLYSGISAG
ncbi:MAG: oxidoreductase, partial [Chloroflexi bacterium]|nr:oxidoreductase [Chloroflexota bacterium]